MPELPEVETIVRDLRPLLMGRLLTGMVVKGKAQKNILKTDVQTFYEGTILQEVQTVLRKGKYIIMPLTNGNVVVFHLGMTGQLLVNEVPDGSWDDRFGDLDEHVHIVLEFMDQSEMNLPDLELSFRDIRMFGNIWLVHDADDIERLGISGLDSLGPDALGITLAQFEEAMSSKRSVKAILLDQASLAGVGNIYADEACFEAKIHPARPGHSLTGGEKARLWFAVKSVLKEGIRFGGSSTSDYVTADGSKGSFQERHRVYGKTGQKCVDCGHIIEKIKIVGRSTHFCPLCQPRETE